MCIVVAIIGFSQTFYVTRRPFIRDVVMYIGAVSYLLGMLVCSAHERTSASTRPALSAA